MLTFFAGLLFCRWIWLINKPLIRVIWLVRVHKRLIGANMWLIRIDCRLVRIRINVRLSLGWISWITLGAFSEFIFYTVYFFSNSAFNSWIFCSRSINFVRTAKRYLVFGMIYFFSYSTSNSTFLIVRIWLRFSTRVYDIPYWLSNSSFTTTSMSIRVWVWTRARQKGKWFICLKRAFKLMIN